MRSNNDFDLMFLEALQFIVVIFYIIEILVVGSLNPISEIVLIIVFNINKYFVVIDLYILFT